MSPDFRALAIKRFRTRKGQTWAEVRVALNFNDDWTPPPMILVRFPYTASDELNSVPEEITETILRVTNDRLIELLRGAADELVQMPLEARSPYVVLGPPPTR